MQRGGNRARTGFRLNGDMSFPSESFSGAADRICLAGKKTVVVVGNGMVGQRLVEELVERGALRFFNVVVFGEESRPAYDRVGLSTFFNGVTANELSVVPLGFYDQAGVDLILNDEVIGVDRIAQTITASSGTTIHYDTLVLATGSYPFVPPIPGNDLPGCFVYRTLDDLEAIRTYADQLPRGGAVSTQPIGAVIGGGLLGLEAANALCNLGLQTHVVEFADRLMPLQVDEGGGSVLRRRIEQLNVRVHTGMRTSEIFTKDDGAVGGIRFTGADDLAIDLLVFSAGIRPRDALARSCDLEVGERGGIVVDETCRTSDPSVFAIGECALAAGRVWGLVAPGYEMARTVAQQLVAGTGAFNGADLSTKLKLMGVDVASFGDAFGTTIDSLSVTYSDPIAHVYKRLVVDASGAKLLGGILVGDASNYTTLTAMVRGDLPTPTRIEDLIVTRSTNDSQASVIGALTDSAIVCSCNNVTKGAICSAIADQGLSDVGQVKRATKAGSSCGGCMPFVQQLFVDEQRKAGVEVRNEMCEHFAYSRQQLFDIIRVHSITSFAAMIRAHGHGLGCEICKPAIASMFASLSNTHILDGEQASLQDTNDHFLANMQKDGTYSIVPRIPGGEITPDQLVTIGEVARDFGLYTKITGGQRIDMFGARVEQLPDIWARLVGAGMESGHAYGKALRTVKSCVGETWCRYGVQDSTTLAIQLELRYRGLRAPHKFKSAVSGCARECAEAQSKDFGVIATERGWNLYVGGNGGQRPQHAQLFLEDLDTETLIRTIDRFLMFYIRTADRLERTATWLNRLDGGIDYLRTVIVDDALGLCSELDTSMATHVASYECEWKATLESPERMQRFRSFVNADVPDPTIVHIRERGQIRPARVEERSVGHNEQLALSGATQ
jgi:nitrite reductase (NADH) large subunit